MEPTSLTRKEIGAHRKGLVLGSYSLGSTDITTPGKAQYSHGAITGLMKMALIAKCLRRQD